MTPEKHALLSPSSARRWLNCTPAPRLESGFPENISEFAEEGRLAHSVCELIARRKFAHMKTREYTPALKKLTADPLWQDEMLITANTYVDHLAERIMSFEHPPYTAFEVKVDISDYVPEAFGTCDCVIIGAGSLIITDYKHGKGVPVSAHENPQMMLYALGALKTYRPIYGDSIKRVSVYIDQPRLNSYEDYTLPVNELLAWGEKVVKSKAAEAFAGTGSFNPGEWCRFCRAASQCRARADAHTALEDFAAQSPFDGKTGGALLTDAEIGDLLVRGKALVEWYERMKEYALTTCLNGGEIPGWKAVEGRSSRAWADQDKALAAILAAGYSRAIIYDEIPKSLAQLEKLLNLEVKGTFDKLVGEFVIKPPGKPALAPESDKREAYNRAAADFAETASEQTTEQKANN